MSSLTFLKNSKRLLNTCRTIFKTPTPGLNFHTTLSPYFFFRNGLLKANSCIRPAYIHGSCACKFEKSYEVQDPEQKTNSDDTQTWDDLRKQHGSKFAPSKSRVLEIGEVVEFLREEGALDIVVIEIPKEMCYVDYFVIATATSSRHLGSVAEMTNKFYKQERKAGQPFSVIEGKRVSDDWQCLDLGNMVIHVMLEETRDEYSLEKLWVLGQKFDDLMHESPSSEEILKRLSMEGLNLMSMDEDTVKALGNLDISNPWTNESDDFYGQEQDAFVRANLETDTQSSSQKTKPDELEDDDAFLV